MKVAAVTTPGSEYLYRASSAHKVSERSAAYILGVLNLYRFKLRPGEIWYLYEVDQYDTAYIYAEDQHFTVRKGLVTERY